MAWSYCMAGGVSLLLCATAPAGAADLPEAARPRLLEQFNHTAWGALDDAPVDVFNFAQTRDGWLWLATAIGLFRFDGKRYERMDEIDGHPLLSANVLALYAAPDGGLWLGYRVTGGVSHFHDGKVEHYTVAQGLPGGSVSHITRGPDGTIWAATRDGLARLDAGRFHTIAPDQGLPARAARQVLFDRKGTQWVAIQGGIYFRHQGESNFQPAWPGGDLMGMALAPDGTVWGSDAIDSYYPMATSAPAGSKGARPARAVLPGSGMHFDRDGNMWLLRSDSIELRKQDAGGAWQPAYPGQQLTPDHGLSGGLPQSFFQDREGNVWIGTSAGVDRIRRNRLSTLPLSGEFDHAAIAPAVGGGIWAGDHMGPLRRFDTGGLRSSEPAPVVATAYRDPDGVLWLANDTEIWRRDGASRSRIPLPTALQGYEVQVMARAQNGGLWVSASSKGLFLLQDGQWRRNGGLSGLPERYATSLSRVEDGRLWAGYSNNEIVHIDGANLSHYGARQGLDLGAVLSLHQYGGQLWAGGERGVACLDGNRFITLKGSKGERFRGVSGIVHTDDGDLWLFGADGLSRIPAAELTELMREPEHSVAYERYDARDGLIGTAAQLRPLPSLIQDDQGLLWFATASKIGWIDPRHIRRNPVPPPVLVQALVADERYYAARPGLLLPQYTSKLRLDFTALSLSIPERVRFRYRLDGVDLDWQDPGPRRQAFYTNLGPGAYRFRVMAANEDGVWNESEAALDFRIEPAFAQTLWFKGLCALALLLALYLLYQLRLRQLTLELQRRIEERVDERERIARALHDTFLQSVQGLMLRFQTLLKRLPPDGEAHALAEKILDQADQVLTEGRNQVRGLRDMNLCQYDLQQAFAELGRLLSESESGARGGIGLVVRGRPRALTESALEHLYHIGREALLNAARHGDARRIELELSYADQYLLMLVRDDGKGMDQAVLQAGQRPGHWGLTGMRERAGKLDATLELWSRPGKGSEVRLKAPAAAVYARPGKRTPWQRFGSWLARDPV